MQLSDHKEGFSRLAGEAGSDLGTLPVQAVKSISLRHLAMTWRKLQSAAAELPRFESFQPGERSHDLNRTVLWRVKERDGVRSFAPAFKGAHIIEAFGQRVYLDLIASQALRDIITSGLEDCAASVSPVYMTIESPDPNNHPIECERLLLPFGEGSAVRHIFAAIEISSIAGTFDRKTIVKRFELQSRVTMCGRVA